jgi:Uma2 family endonuclease
MATAQLAPPTEEQRFLLSHVNWQTYLHFCEALWGRRVRLTYDRGRIELMTTSSRHEGWKRVLGRFVETLCEELGLDFASFGSMTMRREDLDRGFEPDECFYIQSEPLVHGRLDIDIDHDPPPDLAVEVEVSRSMIDRISIYAAMGVPELWRFDGETLRVLQLTAERRYVPAERSLAFPELPLDEFAQYVRQREAMADSQQWRAFRAWVRATLLPPPPAAGEPAGPGL